MPEDGPVAQLVKTPPASTGHSRDAALIPGSGGPPGEGNVNILAWEIPWTEGPGGL